MEEEDFWDGNIIYSYTRAQAIADGVLVDVSELAKEAGFKVPTAVTCAVWADVIEPSEQAKEDFGQSDTGRLWDILMVLHCAARGNDSSVILFTVAVMGEEGIQDVELKAIIGPGDTPEPVLTIMFPHED